jgi:hypothetical protein
MRMIADPFVNMKLQMPGIPFDFGGSSLNISASVSEFATAETDALD